MTSAQDIIILFTKFPEPGKSKTRLIPRLGAEKAAELQRLMTLEVCGKLKKLQMRRPCRVEIHYTGGNREAVQQWLGTSFVYKKQCEGSLGLRMYSSLQQHLGKEQAIVLLGADCPAVDQKLLEKGLTELKSHDIIIGPAHDGGYYLIGVRGDTEPDRLKPLFFGIDWGTSRVLPQTLEKIQTEQLSYRLLKKLHDIDTPEDLRYLHNHPDLERRAQYSGFGRGSEEL